MPDFLDRQEFMFVCQEYEKPRGEHDLKPGEKPWTPDKNKE